MRVEYLKEFLVLADTKNYLTAAEELFISQATLSRHILFMEEQFGEKLFYRTTRSIELTEFGFYLLPYAQRVTELREEAISKLKLKQKQMDDEIVVGAFHHMSAYRITDMLARFMAEYPNIRVTLLDKHEKKLLSMLNERECDFIFVRGTAGEEFGDISAVEFTADRMAALLSVNHELANHETINLEQLKDEEFLMPNRQSTLYGYCIQACEKLGFRPKAVSLEVEGKSIFDIVGYGYCVSLHSQTTAADIIDNHKELTRLIPIEPELRLGINLLYKKKYLTSAGERFIAFVNQYLGTIGENYEV